MLKLLAVTAAVLALASPALASPKCYYKTVVTVTQHGDSWNHQSSLSSTSEGVGPTESTSQVLVCHDCKPS